MVGKGLPTILWPGGEEHGAAIAAREPRRAGKTRVD